MNPIRLLSLLFWWFPSSGSLFADGRAILCVSRRETIGTRELLSHPFRTVERARDAVRALRREGKPAMPATVYLRQGTYTLASTLTLLPEDGGSAAFPVSYRAYMKERPVISGGRVVDGWKELQRNGQRIWTVSLPDVKSGSLAFRQLWVDGNRRTRARHPNKGYLKIQAVPGVTEKTAWFEGSVSFQFVPGDVPTDWTLHRRRSDRDEPLGRVTSAGHTCRCAGATRSVLPGGRPSRLNQEITTTSRMSRKPWILRENGSWIAPPASSGTSLCPGRRSGRPVWSSLSSNKFCAWRVTPADGAVHRTCELPGDHFFAFRMESSGHAQLQAAIRHGGYRCRKGSRGWRFSAGCLRGPGCNLRSGSTQCDVRWVRDFSCRYVCN